VKEMSSIFGIRRESIEENSAAALWMTRDLVGTGGIIFGSSSYRAL